MPNRVKRNSVVEMLAKVPVNRGSLLKSIENLLKTIESSESAVMIPTLLRDKCEFDAWELLFVAKILKASILGHSDLVEFYMNHFGHSSSQFQQQSPISQASSSSTLNNGGTNGNNNNNSNTSGNNNGMSAVNYQQQQQQQQQEIPAAASLSPRRPTTLSPSNHHHHLITTLPVGSQPNNNDTMIQNQQQSFITSPLSTSSSMSSTQTQTLSSVSEESEFSNSKSQSSASWVTANGNQQQNSGTSQQTSPSSACSNSSTFNGIKSISSTDSIGPLPVAHPVTTSNNVSGGGGGGGVCGQDQTIQLVGSSALNADQLVVVNGSGDLTSTNNLLAAARPLLMRQAQPPSLLQLTTTNNHINSVAAIGSVSTGFTNNSIEQLTNQLTAMQQSGHLSGASLLSTSPTSSSNQDRSPLSISTGVSGATQAPASFTSSSSSSSSHLTTQTHTNGTVNSSSSNSNVGGGGTINSSSSNGGGGGGGGSTISSSEGMRASRSAGCLFRINSSGASSPRTPLQTPTTPYPQAETLGNGHLAMNGQLPGDPSAPVKLLLQIEQLKSSINHVTNLLESVVELYKKSIDNIAMA